MNGASSPGVSCWVTIGSTTAGWLLPAILVLWAAAMAPSSATAQQQYNNAQGYTCRGRDSTCSTYAFYRTFKAQESLATVASYFNMTAAGVAVVSELTDLAPNLGALPMGQALYIPMQCSCDQDYVTSQMQVPYMLQAGDTFFLVAATTYGALTTYQAMETWNSGTDVSNLVIGDTIVVPIFCACPTAEQISHGTNFLVTYSVYGNESLDFISGNFGITTEELSAANELAVNATLENFSSLLVPVVALPAIAAMKFPQNNISQGPGIVSPTANYSQRRKVGIIAGLSAGVVAVLVVAGLVIEWYRRRTSSKEQDKLSSDFSLVDQSLVLRMFAFKELKKATKNFSRSEILGSGGFGAVYKGTLPSGELVAVKRIRMESKHGKESFRAEVTSLSHIRHRNLVQLRGWCHGGEQLFLVYDFKCNGSLYEWLFQYPDCCEKRHGKGMPYFGDAEAIPLKLRHSVLSRVAAALAYLHEECAQCVLHRDIKSSNVLLDGDLNAYLGDFGPPRLIDHPKMAKTTMMAGTLGYMAPEMPYTGKATKETDVFSFGMLTLEVMCGTRPLDVIAIERGDGILVDRAWRAHEGGNILQVAESRPGAFPPSDANASSHDEIELQVASSCLMSSDMHDVHPSAIYAPDSAMEEKKRIANLLHLGLLCCNPNPEDRPSMRLVSQLLQSSETDEIAMPPLPICKPQVHYETVGFSQLAMRLAVGTPPSTVVVVQDAQHGSFHSTPPSASDHQAGMLKSFTAPDSSVLSGR